MGTRTSTTAGSGGIWCPFYIKQGERQLCCEGPTEDCRLFLRYDTRQDMLRQRRIFCEGSHRNCQIYRMLMRDKYGEDDVP